MTDADYAAWLADQSNQRCVLVDIQYRSAGGTIIYDYLSTHPFVTEASDSPASTAYRCVVKKVGEFIQEMTDVLLGRTTASRGSITVDNGDGALDDWTTANFAGRPATMYLGDPSWPKVDYRAVWTGVMSEITVQNTNTITLTLRARDHLLTQDVVTTKFSTGPNKGKHHPLVYGWAYNVPALLITASPTNTYKVCTTGIYDVVAVRADGNTVSFSEDLSDGEFTLTDTPSGQVTADIKGIAEGSLYEKIKDIVKDLCVTRGPFVEADFDSTYWANLNTTFAQTMGLWIPQPTKYYELLDMICASVGAFYCVQRDGTIAIRKFELSGTATLELGEHQIVKGGINIERIYQPLDNLRRGYERKWTTQNLNGVDYTFTEPDGPLGSAPRHVDTDRENWSNEYKWVVSTNSGSANLLKTKDPPPQGTLLKTESDCQTEADRWMGIWGSVRRQFSIDCFLDGAQVNLGDRVKITHSRYGLSAGATGTVVKIIDRFTKRRQTLGVLM